MTRFRLKGLFTSTLVATALCAVSPAADASPIVGSLTLSSDGVFDNGQPLTARDVFVPQNLRTGLRTGDFTLVANGKPVSGGTLDLTNLESFAFDITGAGSFTDAGAGNVIGQRTASNLDVYFLGVFTPEPGGPLGAFDPSESSVRFSLTRTGSVDDFSISFSGTEAAPPAIPPTPTSVPEPISLMLLGSGLLSIGLSRLRSTNR